MKIAKWLGRERIPNSKKALSRKILFAGRREFGDPVVEQSMGKAQIDDSVRTAILVSKLSMCGEYQLWHTAVHSSSGANVAPRSKGWGLVQDSARVLPGG